MRAAQQAKKTTQTIESKSELDRIIGVGSASDPARTILAALAPLQGPFERKRHRHR